MSSKISDLKPFSAFAIIVDLNGFTKLVEGGESQSPAQFVHDALYGGIQAVEDNGGEVVGFMGDAFLAICEDVEATFTICVKIAKDVDSACEFISNAQKENPYAFDFAPGGFSLKIGVEFGRFDVSRISSNFLGDQKLFVSSAINHASRILSAGNGNRCHIGPNGMRKGMNMYQTSGPYSALGKHDEQDYLYYELQLGDIWRTGGNEETYWG